MHMWPLFLIILASRSELLYVIEVSRHGARAPMKAMPWDNPSSWPLGYKNLLPEGLHQHYLIGKYFYDVYVLQENFISEKYLPHEIQVFSTTAKRAIQSAQSQILGIFPEFEGNNNENDVFLPICNVSDEDHLDLGMNFTKMPIHVNDFIESVLLSQDLCDEYTKFIQYQNKNPRIYEIYEKYSDVIEIAAKKLSSSIELAQKDILKVIDSIKTHQFMNYEYPVEFDKKWLEEASNLYLEIRNFQRFPSDYLKRYAASAFFEELLKDFRLKLLKKTEKKAKIYSAHDTTIMNIFATLGISLEKQPPFASVIFFELRLIDREYFVNILYNGQQISIPELDFPIAYEDFKHFLMSRIFPNVTDACKGIADPVNHMDYYENLGITNEGITEKEIFQQENKQNDLIIEEKNQEFQQTNEKNEDYNQKMIGTEIISEITEKNETIFEKEKMDELSEKYKHFIEKSRRGIGKNSKNVNLFTKNSEDVDSGTGLIYAQIAAFLIALILVFYIIKKNNLRS